jgi:hypothetical protein
MLKVCRTDTLDKSAGVHSHAAPLRFGIAHRNLAGKLWNAAKAQCPHSDWVGRRPQRPAARAPAGPPRRPARAARRRSRSRPGSGSPRSARAAAAACAEGGHQHAQRGRLCTLAEAAGPAPGQGDPAQLHGRQPCWPACVRCAARARCPEAKHGGKNERSAGCARTWSA